METNKTVRKLQIFINWSLHRREVLKWYDKTTNEEIMEKTKQIPVKQNVRKQWG